MIKSLKKVLYILEFKQKVRLVELLVIIIIGTFLELFGITIILPFLDVITTPELVQEKWYLQFLYQILKASDINNFLLSLSIMILLIYIVKNIFVAVMYKLQYKYTYYNHERLAQKMMKYYLGCDYLFHTTQNSADILRNIQGDTGMFFNAVLAFLQLTTEGLVCLALVIFLFCMDTMITIAVVCIMIFFLFIYIKRFKARLNDVGIKSREDTAEINKCILQMFGGIKENIVMHKEGFFLEKFKDASGKYAKHQTDYMFYLILPRPFMEAICIIGLMGVIIVRLHNLEMAENFISMLAVFAVAAFRLLPSFNRLSQYIGTLSYNKSAIDAVYNNLKNVQEITQYTKQNIYIKKWKIINEISVSNINFAYPNGEMVLKDVNFKIPKNKAVAFIGPSGAGKTTIIDIILGLLKTNDGEVKVDGRNIFDSIWEWRATIGYIPQNIFLLDDTLQNNIAYGLTESEIDYKRLEQAIEDAQLKELIGELKEGQNTVIGERGIRLSGGQRQRIGIARALYLNPEILILDEATSALDSDTEKAVMQAIDHLAGKKTLIIIAHRLSTIQKCDIIFEVKNRTVSVIKSV